jgi:hypothetical protein
MSETKPAPRKRRGRVALVLLSLCLAVLIGLGAAAKWARDIYEAPGPLAADFGMERFREGRFIDESVAAGVAH